MLWPLQSMLKAQRYWTPNVYSMYGRSEFIFNHFGCLSLTSIRHATMGVRFKGLVSGSLRLISDRSPYFVLREALIGTSGKAWLYRWLVCFTTSGNLACLGFMILGCGMEMTCISV